MTTQDLGAPDMGGTVAAAPAASPDLGRRVAVSAAIMVAARVLIRCLSIVSTLILVRLLVPEDFGLIALAGAAFALVDVVTATNLGMALMRKANVDKALYDTAWTLNVLRGLLLGAVVALTATWQAELLGDPRVGPVLWAVAATAALDGFTSIGLVRLQREMRFDLMFRYQLAWKLVAFTLTIGLAVTLQSYWCLVLGTLASRVFTIPYSYWLAPHRPRFSLAGAGELLHFSKWMVAVNACAVVDAQMGNLILGRLAGLNAVGTYQIAYQLAAVPVTEIAVPVRNPIYAGYAGIYHQLDLLRRHYLTGFGFLFAVITPLSVGIALTAPQVQRIALGPEWAAAAPIIALCALYALADCVAHFTFNLFMVLNRQDKFLKTYVLMLAIRLPAAAFGAMHGGAVGMALAMLGTALLNALIWHAQAARLMGMPLRGLVAATWRTVLAAGAMAAAVLAAQRALPPAGDGMAVAAAELCLLAALGALVHVGCQALLWHLSGRPQGAEARMLRGLAAVMARLPGRPFPLSR